MGNAESNGKEFAKSGIMKKLFSNKEIRILMVGLDCAGKTTILYNLKMGKVVRTIPTIGFNVETVEYKNISFTVWDIGGQDKIRPLWRHYFYNVQGIIFVVDSNDRDRLDEAREELFSLLGEDELKECVVLILANKQDQPNCMKMDEMQQKLNIPTFLNRRWRLQPSCAVTGQGLQDGLQWLSMQFKPHKNNEVKKSKVKT